MNNDDVIFVDWMPKEFDVWLKELAKKEDFNKIANNIISYISKLMKPDERTYDCVYRGKDCGSEPEIMISEGVGISFASWFCSRDCFIKAILTPEEYNNRKIARNLKG